MRSDEFDTVKMLKRLQRQVSRLRGGDTEESVTLFQEVSDTASTADTVEYPGYGYEVDSESFAMGMPQAVEDAMNAGQYSVMFMLNPQFQPDEDDWHDYFEYNADSWRVEETNPTGGGNSTVEAARLYVEDASASGATHEMVGAIPHTPDEYYAGGYTVDATATGGDVLSYKDGVEVDAVTHPGKDNQSTFSVSEFTLSNSGMRFGIDRIDFYNRTLSPNEVQSWHNLSFPTSGLVSSLQFDTGPGTTPEDSVTGTVASTHQGSYIAPLQWALDRGFIWGVDKFSQKSW